MPKLTNDGSVLSWASTLEPAALEQAQTTASMPFVVKPLALMPDAHLGLGSTIGSVIATEGAIIPAAVGVDIGCGMIAVETNLTSHSLPDDLGVLMGLIRDSIPAGFGKSHAKVGNVNVFDLIGSEPVTELTSKQENTIHLQFGTLGSGNHFVEVCLDERDVVWLVLHSGSRGIGNQLAKKHIDTAKGRMKEWFISLPDPDLAYLPEGTPEFRAYVADLLWAQQYAAENRNAMMGAAVFAMEMFLAVNDIETSRINCHHNFTQREHHHKRNMWVTRKGAISARDGQLGVIPGSMGTRSYIVEGLGSPASYTSCSHGAGRRMSRTAAKKTLSVESLQTAMEGKTWNSHDAADLVDEHPQAYKDIDEVMWDQRDLVRPLHILRQILNYKGTK